MGESIKKECDKLFTLGIMLLDLADTLKVLDGPVEGNML